jgi:cytochrome c
MRKHRQKLLCLLIFTAASLAAGSATAADGKALYTSKGCVACHGDAGKAPIMPNYPKLAGQNSAYMLEQMKDIKSGARNNGQAAVMKPIVASVTEDEMKAIADYLSKQ